MRPHDSIIDPKSAAEVFTAADRKWAQRQITQIWQHFKEQPRLAKAGWLKQSRLARPDIFCYYRLPGTGDSGTDDSCAIGCLIPDRLYSEKLEGGTVFRLLRSRNKLWRRLQVVLLGRDLCEATKVRRAVFLRACQVAHDRAWSVPEVFCGLKLIARDFDLTLPE